MLYNLLLKLEERRVYSELLKAGAIPFRINTDFQIYKTYLRYSKTKVRKTQIIFNISVEKKCSMKYVYRAINKMEEPVLIGQEITLF